MLRAMIILCAVAAWPSYADEWDDMYRDIQAQRRHRELMDAISESQGGTVPVYPAPNAAPKDEPRGVPVEDIRRYLKCLEVYGEANCQLRRQP